MFHESQVLGRKERAASQIRDKRNALFPRERSDSCRRWRFYKTAHEKIAAMNFKNESRVWPNCFRVIIERRFICCADLPQLRPGRLDYFADAKAAADLDHLAA